MGVTNWICLAFSIACLGSFAWGMRYFFAQPAGYTRGMRLTQGLGIACAAVQIAGICVVHIAAMPFAISVVFYVGALALFWWAIRTNRSCRLSAVFSPDLPAHLVREGPYSYVRHPFYTSYLLCALAAGVATLHAAVLATFFVLLSLYWRATTLEEGKFASSALRDEYAHYRSRTGRFFPKPRWLSRSTRE